MTTNLAKTYKTSIGRFKYIRLSLPYYSFGLQRVELGPRQMALIAGKEKSLCDKIVTTPRLKLRSVRQTKDYLMEDLRISKANLGELDTGAIKEFLKETPKRESISILLKTLVDL